MLTYLLELLSWNRRLLRKRSINSSHSTSNFILLLVMFHRAIVYLENVWDFLLFGSIVLYKNPLVVPYNLEELTFNTWSYKKCSRVKCSSFPLVRPRDVRVQKCNPCSLSTELKRTFSSFSPDARKTDSSHNMITHVDRTVEHLYGISFSGTRCYNLMYSDSLYLRRCMYYIG